MACQPICGCRRYGRPLQLDSLWQSSFVYTLEQHINISDSKNQIGGVGICALFSRRWFGYFGILSFFQTSTQPWRSFVSPNVLIKPQIVLSQMVRECYRAPFYNLWLPIPALKSTHRRDWSYQNAQSFPNARHLRREPTISLLSMDSIWLLKRLCIPIAAAVIQFAHERKTRRLEIWDWAIRWRLQRYIDRKGELLYSKPASAMRIQQRQQSKTQCRHLSRRVLQPWCGEVGRAKSSFCWSRSNTGMLTASRRSSMVLKTEILEVSRFRGSVGLKLRCQQNEQTGHGERHMLTCPSWQCSAVVTNAALAYSVGERR